MNSMPSRVAASGQLPEHRLTFEASYRARLNHVMQNPVKHGLVKDAKDDR